jgi:hypothetical protein
VTTGEALNRVLAALQARGYEPKHVGAAWRYRCPAHDGGDRNAYALERPGEVKVGCHSRGCSSDDILTAIGLDWRDRYDNRRDVKYVYPDGRVNVRYWDPVKGKKKFTQRGNTAGSAPYIAGDLTTAVEVWLVEGEGEAGAIHMHTGAVAVSTAEGFNGAKKTDLTVLAGKTVHIFPDNDEGGETWLTSVLEKLADIDCEYVVHRAPDGCKDASDVLAAGLDLDTLEDITDPDLEVTTLDTVTLTRVRYLWDRRIPIGSMTICPGEEGIGKTTVLTKIAADITRGLLPGEHEGTPRDVIVLSLEDGLADVVGPRYKAAGADMSRVHRVRLKQGDLTIPRDLTRVGRVVRSKNAALVVIDSLVTVFPPETKTIAYKDVASILKRVNEWAEREHISVVAPWHLNKGTGGNSANRMMDSRAFSTSVRSKLMIVADPDAPDGERIGIIALDKSNGSRNDICAYRYRIDSYHYTVEEVDPETGLTRTVDADCGTATWIGEVPGGKAAAEDLLERASGGMERGDACGDWLTEYLTAHGATLKEDVIADADAAGYSARQLERAAARVRVRTTTVPVTRPGTTPLRKAQWSIPDARSGSVAVSPPVSPAQLPMARPARPGETVADLQERNQAMPLMISQGDGLAGLAGLAMDGKNVGETASGENASGDPPRFVFTPADIPPGEMTPAMRRLTEPSDPHPARFFRADMPCPACSDLLHPALVREGYTAHPGCRHVEGVAS